MQTGSGGVIGNWLCMLFLFILTQTANHLRVQMMLECDSPQQLTKYNNKKTNKNNNKCRRNLQVVR